LLVLTRALFVNNEIYLAFLLISQPQGVSGKNEQSIQTPWRGAPEARSPMQLHRLHRHKSPAKTTFHAELGNPITRQAVELESCSNPLRIQQVL